MSGIRPFLSGDCEDVSSLAIACGQAGPISAENSSYLDFVAGSGSLWVAGEGRNLVGFTGTNQRGRATYLTDLFVHPAHQDKGHGRALLERAWGDSSSRMTSSSQDPRALASYLRYGARPRWPHLYLEFTAGSTLPTTQIITAPWATNDCGWNWPIPSAQTVSVIDSNGVVAARAVVLVEGTDESTHLHVLRVVTPHPRSLVDLVTYLRTLVGDRGRLSISIPGPHLALPTLLESGAHIVDVDLWCATDDVADLIDPLHELPSPAFG